MCYWMPRNLPWGTPTEQNGNASLSVFILLHRVFIIFIVFCLLPTEHHIDPKSASKPQILSYLVSLQQLGLSSLKVHLAAISVHHNLFEGHSLFSHRIVQMFRKGLLWLHPPRKPIVPEWSLSLVLSKLMGKLFEPLTKTFLYLFSRKTALLVDITSAKRCSDICVKCIDTSYMVFYRDKVVLQLDPSFLPKVVSSFHLSKPIVLSIFYPNPAITRHQALHTLNVHRVLLFYLDRTHFFQKDIYFLW